MTYDLYFHNDMDGIASAAVMLDYLRQRGDGAGRFVALDYLIIPEWKRNDFFERNSLVGESCNPAIVLDFPYHPKAAIWFDHHPSTFKMAAWAKNFKPSREHNFNASYLSCCRFVMEILEKKFGYDPPARIEELARWLDVIDSARYASARQTIELKVPALRLTAALESRRGKDRSMRRFVELLAGRSIREALQDKDVAKLFWRVKRETAESLQRYKKELKLAGKVVFVDETGFYVSTLRFAPLYFEPRASFVVRMRQDEHKKEIYHLSAGVNPWRMPKKFPHLGRLMARFGGGGHERVGGLEVKGLEKTIAIRDAIISKLNEK